MSEMKRRKLMVDSNTPIQPEPEKVPSPRKRKGNSGESPAPLPEPEVTFDRAESLPDEAQAAPEMTPSQEATNLDELIDAAVAPEDEDAGGDYESGPPQYVVLQRQTRPPKAIPFCSLPKAQGSKTVYLLTVDRQARGEGELDTYLVSQGVYKALKAHPVFQRQIKRFLIRLCATSLGVPFFFEINLDDHGVWGATRRGLGERAEGEWVLATAGDMSTGYVRLPSAYSEEPVFPMQTFNELYTSTYKTCFIQTLDHPVIKRGALRKAK
jgi:hypothetical protein